MAFGRKEPLAFKKFNRSMLVFFLMLVAIVGVWFSFVGSAKAATTFTVNTTMDVVDANPGNGICNDGNGDCSIRAALMEANALAGTDTITIPPGTYTLNSTLGQLVINSDVILDGNLGNPANTIIQAASNAASATNRVLSINPNVSTPGYDVKIQGLTIRYGKAPIGYGGGGIDGDAGTRTIEIAHSIIEDNHTSGVGFGGGAYLSGAAGGTVKLNDVIFRNNEAGVSSSSSYSSQGGGVFLQGDMNLDLVNVTVTNNTSYGLGGGMAITPETTTSRIVTITNGSFTGNRAASKASGAGSEGQAGGIYLGVPVNISNTMISNNTAGGDGGGLVLDHYFGKVNLSNVTLTDNTAVRGGAIYVSGSSIPSMLNDVVMSGNTGGNLTINPDKQDLQVAIAPASGSNGTFSPGKTGAHYTVTVYNSGTPPVSGPVTTVVTLPTGLTPTAMSGIGWSCTYTTGTCSRSDIPQGQSAYPPIDLTVNVAANAARTLTSSVTVSGGTEMYTSNNSASYATTVVSNDSLLSNLTVSKGILAPAFDAGKRAYTVSLPYVDDTLKVMPTVHESHATVTVNNSSVESGTLSESISLLVGNTDINITVRAEDGTTTTTVITVNRALPNVSSIAVSGANDATSVIIGSTLQMSAFVSPGNAGDKSISWSIDASTGNASISSEGLLTGTALGEVLVKATANDGSGIVGTKSITIAPKKVTSIDVMSQGEASSVQNGEQLQLSALVYPTDATNRTVVWSVVPGTGDAEIDESTGLLTGTAVGEVLVKAAATDESGIVGTMNIEITKIPVISIEVISESETTNVRNGKTLQLRAMVSPDNATDASVTWSVEREGTGDASIDSSGVLTGTAVGTVIAIATANDNPEIIGTLEVTIEAIPVTEIIVTSANNVTSISNGSLLQMSASVLPENATNKSVTWSVEQGSEYATIDESTGLLTGTAVGEVLVKAAATDESGIVGTMNIEITKIPVISIEVISESETTNVRNGKTLQLRALVSPNNATNRTVEWSVVPGTGDASIDSSGVLTGAAVGTVTVTATANDNPEVVGTLEVTIEAIPVTGIVVTSERESASVSNGKTLQMFALVSPDDATDRTVEWSVVPGTGNASIDSSGVLLGAAVGTVTVTATANDNPDIIGTMEVTIAPILVTSIDVSSANNITSVPNGSTLQMSAKVLPGNATNDSVTWSVEAGTGTATISPFGLLTGTAVGDVVVKATANDLSGVVGTKTITIAAIPVTSIVVTGADGAASVSNGSSLQMSAAVLPENATNTSVTWSVEAGTGTATISSSGLLTGTAVGDVVVKATANDLSGVVGRKTITIAAIPVTSIVVTGADGAASVSNGSSLQMSAAVLPENATDTSVTWSVEAGTGTATISSSGLLTGTAVGDVVVKATANDLSGVVGTKTITIAAIPVTSIVVTGADGAASVSNGSSLQMSAAVLPENATNTSVTWSVEAGTGTATISSSGLLTGTAVGDVVVKATANDLSGVVGRKTITIAAIPVTSIVVTGADGAASVSNGSSLQMSAAVLPENATDTSVTWSVEAGTGTATISSSGLLTGTAVGDVVVKATANDLSGVVGTKTITIAAIPVTSIVVTGADGAASVSNGSSLQMSAAVLPENATNTSVTWSVEAGTGTATISSSGLLTGTAVGDVVVKATANDLSGVVGRKTITIAAIPVTSIVVTGADGAASVSNGSSLQMSAAVLPENATNTSVTWSVEAGTGTATISSSGLLTGTAVGDVVVKATANDLSGVVGRKTITIAAIPVTSIVVTGADGAASVSNGSSLQMSAAVLPENATDTSVTWSVEAGTGTATISSSGLLTGTAVGDVVVKATANDLSGVVGTKTITIAAIPVTSIVVTGADGAASVSNGSSLQMSAAVLPENATNTSVTWSVEAGTGTATISSSGLLTGTAVGDVVVKATANDLSGVVGRKTITIAAIPVTSIVVTGADGAASVSNGSSLQMSAAVLPENATDTSVTWSVEAGTGTATISSSGLLTGTAVGDVVVKATANDLSGVVGTKTITIAAIPVTSIVVTGADGAASVSNGSSLQMSAAVLPENATNTSVTWSVEAGTGTATISSSGLLTGTAVGDVVVKATANDLSGVVGRKTITIAAIPVTSIVVTGADGAASVSNGSSLQMSAAVLPENATNTSVTWSVEAGTGTATISSSGLLTGTAVGDVVVKATANDLSGVVGRKTITIAAIPVTSIVVTGADGAATVSNGSSLQMSAAVLPENATDTSVTWSVEAGTGTATISPSGLLTGTAVGDIVVKATANDLSGVVGRKTITIAAIPVTSIVVTGADGAASVSNGSSLQMSAAVLPENATDTSVTWSVEAGTGTATISPFGLLTGTAVGDVVVKATANDLSGAVGRKTITIASIPVTSIVVTGADGAASVSNGSSLQMNAAVLPENATNTSVTWSVEAGTGTATISPSGLLTGTAVGDVVVKVTANDLSGVVGTKTITIASIPVTSIVVTGADGAASVSNGSSLQMSAAVLPENATDTSVTWSVEAGTGTATISPSGLLTGTAVGDVVVKATANDLSGAVGRKTITIAAIPVASIVVTGADGAGNVSNGSSLQMSAAVLPENATNTSVTWSVEAGTGTATISSSGLLTGTAVGDVVVKATANDLSGVVGTKTVTIAAIPVTSIVVTGADGAGNVSNGSSLQMSAAVLPENATDTSVTWSVEAGTGTATISSSGVLTGTAVGTVTVKATAKDGSNIVGSKSITIAAVPVTEIIVSGANSVTSITYGSPLQMNATVLPQNATNQSVTWSVEAGTGNAAIDETTGILRGTEVGTVTVKATAKDTSGIVGTKNITIAALLVNSIVVTGADDATTVTNGNSLQMSAAVWPENASNTDVAWSVVANTGKATINATGLLTATQVGTVTVIATAVDGSGTRGSKTITIAAIPISQIEVKGAGNLTSVVAGNTLQMIANVLPENATNASVTWSVYGNSGASTISDLGVLYAIEPGIVTVTATATDGSGIKGSTAISITPVPEVPVMTISISVKETSNRDAVVIGGTLQLEASVLPLNVTNSSVTWHVYGNGNGNTGNALISQSGLLTATGIGTVTVEARANDGSGIVGKKVITITSDAPQIKLSPISTKVQGEVVELRGMTNLNGLTITILAPNDSVLTSFNDVSVTNGTFFDSRFILPQNAEPGMYTVIANNGIISTEMSFAVIPISTFELLDHDHDGRIQIDDLVIFISSNSPTRDFNLDGRIDRNDITFILSLISSMID
ncbi:Ig-like domain-containing protein [Paenibacillus sp. LjRoot56]|uniref:Ig-like domain-containing protein n=1 Tax=Paenibacillus sp. LjRoot56 TaxID=3342333 RepID=UPI003ECD57B0